MKFVLILLAFTFRAIKCKIFRGQYTTTFSTFIESAYPDYFEKEILEIINYESINPKDPEVYCSFKCLYNEKCRSIHVKKKFTRCVLLSLDNCISDRYLTVNDYPGDHIFFEVRDGNELKPSLTCFENCITVNGCDACGNRGNCNGHLCSGPCVSTCWELQPQRIGDVRLRDGPYVPQFSYANIECDMEWHLVWRLDLFFIGSIENSTRIKVKLFYEDGTDRSVIFGGLFITSTELSVGPMMENSQLVGNFWQAPFTSRTLVPSASDSPCKPFFYQGTPCDSEPERSKNSYVWITGNPNLDNQLITSIEVWATEDIP